MNDLFNSLEKTIRETGFLAFKFLLILNALGLFFVWAIMLIPQAPLLQLQAAWPHFLLGIVGVFAGLAITYLYAQISIIGRRPHDMLFALMIACPAFSLITFCVGIIFALTLRAAV